MNYGGRDQSIDEILRDLRPNGKIPDSVELIIKTVAESCNKLKPQEQEDFKRWLIKTRNDMLENKDLDPMPSSLAQAICAIPVDGRWMRTLVLELVAYIACDYSLFSRMDSDNPESRDNSSSLR